jgi:hypothetical protein
VTLLERVLKWISTPGGGLGRPIVEGAPDLAPLSVPMILLNCAVELSRPLPPAEGRAFFAKERAAWVADVLRHSIRDATAADPATAAALATRGGFAPDLLLEGVRASDGAADLATPAGRTINPGHAVEAAWFVAAEARVRAEGAREAGDAAAAAEAAALSARARSILRDSFRAGWDGASAPAAAHCLPGGPAPGAGSGGIIYFLDALAFTPPALEWPMKCVKKKEGTRGRAECDGAVICRRGSRRVFLG